MGEGEDLAEVVPEGAGLGEVGLDGRQDTGDAAFGIGGGKEAVAGGEEDDAESKFGIGLERLGVPEEEAFLVHGDFGGGQTGTPLAELAEEAAGDKGLADVDGLFGGAVDAAGREEVAAHPVGDGLAGFVEIGLADDVFLGVELEDILIAVGGEVEVAAEDVEEADFGAEFGKPVGEIAGRVLELGEPADHVEIAKAAGGLLDVGFEVEDGVLELFLAFAGLTNKVPDEGLALAGDEFGEAKGEGVVEIGVTAEEALIEEADGEFEVGGVIGATLFNSVDGVGDTKAGVPADAQKRGEGVARFFVGGRPFDEE
jgi:hypothetical protein